MFDYDGKAHNVWYRYKVHPHSPEAALQRIGLEKTSEPIRVLSFYRWCPTCTPASGALFNGDLKLSVRVMDDRGGDGFEAVSVDFLKWTGEELLHKPLH